MIKHLFRLMWNKKRGHVLLIVEILAAFLVLFGVTSLILHNLRNYRQPLGYEYRDVWNVTFDTRGQNDTLATETMQRLKALALTYPEVRAVSLFGSNAPLSASQSNRAIRSEKMSQLTDFFSTDRDFARTLNVPVLEGRWFDKSDEGEGLRPVVLNQPLREKLFGSGPALGKLVSFEDFVDPKKETEKFRVVGVVGNFKSRGEYQTNDPGVFEFIRETKPHWLRTMLVKVAPGTDAAFEARLTKDFAAMTKDWNIDVSYLEKQHVTKQNLTRVPVLIFLIVSAFLLINVALGLFGVLNLSIAKRRSEIGVRRAMGATAGSITAQFVGEIWVLATFGVLLGLIFAAQFPILRVFDLEPGVYLSAIGVSALVIFVLVTLCAMYPSRQAARVQPSVALHEE
jgi:putative ABC transport system permease protein